MGRIHQNILPGVHMAIFVVGDLHLSLGGDKPMDVFGDKWKNYEKKLETADGRIYYECDVDTLGALSRGAKRLVYSNDGLIYYTGDHYNTFERIDK